MSHMCTGNSKLSKEVTEYLEKLTKKFKIVAITLFGSRQKGTQFKYSDYDFFIISDDFPENYIERIELLWEEKPLWVTPIPWKSDEVKKYFYRPFIMQILLDGEVIYGKIDEFRKLVQDYINKNQLIRTKYGFIQPKSLVEAKINT